MHVFLLGCFVLLLVGAAMTKPSEGIDFAYGTAQVVLLGLTPLTILGVSGFVIFLAGGTVVVLVTFDAILMGLVALLALTSLRDLNATALAILFVLIGIPFTGALAAVTAARSRRPPGSG